MAGSLGVALLYRALAIGTMGVVAPITAVCAVVVPVLVNSVRRGWPGPLVLVGMVLALVGIVLVSQPAPSAADAMHVPNGTVPPGVPHAISPREGSADGKSPIAARRTMSPDACDTATTTAVLALLDATPPRKSPAP
jgi:hypothetical protein